MKLRIPIVLLFLAHISTAGVTPVDDALRAKFKLDSFYEKSVTLEGFPILGSAKAMDAGLEEAAIIIGSMLKGREDILKALAANYVRLAIMATKELTCDVPEHSDLTPKARWNRRARGLGATPIRPAVSCGEENLLNCENDPYPNENILIHEFAHSIHQLALNTIDSSFDKRLKSAFKEAIANGKWKGTYAATNHDEYWAEGVQSWFDSNRENDAIHNHVNTRAELVEYDPVLASLCKEVFGDNPWRYRRADNPARLNEPHLKNLDRAKLPKFAWPTAAASSQ